MEPSLKKRVLAGFAVRFALLAAVAWYCWMHTGRMRETSALVKHTVQVSNELGRLRAGLQQTEADERGFVGTADPKFLEAFESGLTATAAQLRLLKELIRDGQQKASLSALEPLVAEWIAVVRNNVDLRQHSGSEAGAGD